MTQGKKTRRVRARRPESLLEEDVLITSQQLAKRWDVNEGSIRMMRYQRRGPRWVTLGRAGRGRKPRVRYWLSVIQVYEKEHGVKT